MRSLRTQLSLAIVFVVLIAVVLISFFSNVLIVRQFEGYIIEQQDARVKTITDNLAQYYNGLTNTWDLNAIHALSMYSLNDGYIIKVSDYRGETVWNAENHDMGLCQQTMMDIMARMEAHGAAGEFVSVNYDLTQNEQKIGTASVKHYGPFFLSENEFSFIGALNVILAVIGVLSLVFSFVVGWLLARRLVRPIRKTADIAAAIADGRYDVQFESKTNTRELNHLVFSINHLSCALARQESLRKQLTADVAHELRTPLATLGTHIEAMVEGIWKPTPERLQSCHEEILRLGKMVADLERLEHAESENLKLEKSFVDLLALSKTVCDNFAGQLANKNQRLEIDGVNVIVSIDKDRVSGVIMNLMSNAVKYAPEGSKISIFIQDTPEFAQLSIEDAGPGIPEAELPYIFERFYRADKSRNRDTGGTGIGLAIVKSVVSAHGGTITAGNHVGGGARFTVTLPKAAR
ncbi:sensor histidine kinase [Stenoxybacter acetivorans]|uniref:sensor histidine kinase n=1 Tax=Stenoxybacter acetivorans TaxID=422441 RepID=UPI000564E580|nr:ATP-binding protein [Stenoxybacter acetivorans]